MTQKTHSALTKVLALVCALFVAVLGLSQEVHKEFIYFGDRLYTALD